MELVNTTPYVVGCTMGTDKSGLDYILAVVKATFNLPNNGVSVLSVEQRPLVLADVFSGEPGYSATLVESDFALFKPNCDVLLTGSAYSPNGKPSTSVIVALSVGTVNKSFRVTGFRQWKLGALGAIAPGESTHFTKMPFSYDTAFGGIDNFHPDVQKHTSYFENPVGIGYHKELDGALVHGAPMPNTEVLGENIRSPIRNYRPMAFGPVGRGWPQRLRYAGTYDEVWQKNKFPFLPDDFDNRYFQAAPLDQQIQYIKGGERVVLQNLTENGYCSFCLPRMNLESVVFYLQTGEFYIAKFAVDSIHFFPDEGVYTMTARASVPFSGDPQICAKVIFGRGSKAWIRAIENGKKFIARDRKLKKPKFSKVLSETEDTE